MSVVKWEKDDLLAIIHMTNGENRHNLVFTEEMNVVMEEIEADRDIRGAVLTSSDPKYWSNGVDVDWMTGRLGDQDYQSVKNFLYDVNEVFKKFLTCPFPVIAAINGHVAANGLVLACACDFRFMRADRGFCLFPEVDLGIPFLPGMIEITKKGIPLYLFEELKYTGKRITAREMKEHHIVLETPDGREAVLERALEFARSFNKERAIFGEMKRRMNRSILAVLDSEDPAYIEALNP